jgi:endothelin-converting enzyme
LADNPKADDKDPDTVIIQVGAPWSIGLPSKEYYNDTKVVAKYRETLEKVINNLAPKHTRWPEESPKAVGIQASHLWGIAHVGAVVEFEAKLAEASPNAEDMNDVTVISSELFERV